MKYALVEIMLVFLDQWRSGSERRGSVRRYITNKNTRICIQTDTSLCEDAQACWKTHPEVIGGLWFGPTPQLCMHFVNTMRGEDFFLLSHICMRPYSYFTNHSACRFWLKIRMWKILHMEEQGKPQN